MATITLTLSARTNKDTGKAEILLRYRNTADFSDDHPGISAITTHLS